MQTVNVTGERCTVCNIDDVIERSIHMIDVIVCSVHNVKL